MHVLGAGRQDDPRSAQVGLEYLAERTGGFAVRNNDCAGAFEQINNDVRDYYVIGYEPDRTTFAPLDESPRLHSIAINVKRQGHHFENSRRKSAFPSRLGEVSVGTVRNTPITSRRPR
ncbi:MAG: hypothetical protein ABIQ52_02595 [Vicinamibacterales bacterium]